jgi:hypothetical protein
MPSSQQNIPILSKMANNIADFVGRKPGVDRDDHVVEPKLGFFIAAADVDVSRFITFVRVE